MRVAVSLSLALGAAALSPPPGGCLEGYRIHHGEYVAATDPGDRSKDPFPSEKDGSYGTPHGVAGATFMGAAQRCHDERLSAVGPPCLSFCFQMTDGSQTDITKGVFFFANTKTYPDDQNIFITYVFDATCPQSTPGGGGGGEGGDGGGCAGGCVFLIVFFTGFFAYFAAGFAYNVVRMEKRGVEAIPQVEFWKDLPFLVKDGALFVVYKATGRDGYATV